ncbi:RNA 2'-phosphotransferase [Erwinia sp. S43]|nr:RNA 2'-phosphotransferase [Erwinia sp. S43]
MHLSYDEDTATQVGQRHGKPIVLKIQSQTMHEQGFRFFQADNGVWLTASVPYRFVSE